MKTYTIETYTKQELTEKYTADNTRFDIALKEHMDKVKALRKALTAEEDAVKNLAFDVFGDNGGNGVFTTETTDAYVLNMDALTELIGADKVAELKNKYSPRHSLKW